MDKSVLANFYLGLLSEQLYEQRKKMEPLLDELEAALEKDMPEVYAKAKTELNRRKAETIASDLAFYGPEKGAWRGHRQLKLSQSEQEKTTKGK